MKMSVCIITSIAVLLPSVALAWDSQTRPGVHNMQTTGTPFPRPPAPYSPYVGPVSLYYDSTAFLATVLKDDIGGELTGGSDDVSINDILLCDPAFAGRPGAPDLAGCKAASAADLSKAEWGWLELRKAADLPNESEHYLLARAAANFAGLSATTIFDPLWVRYPSRNALLASPRDLDSAGRVLTHPLPNQDPSPYLVGQAWTPASDLPTSTQAKRSVSLLEMAQVPDFSSSLADWASGNEQCPISGTDGAFSSDVPQSQVCHQFRMMLGAVNATHFAPLNRQTWKYYHSLALQRMSECNKLTRLKAPFYDFFVGGPDCDGTTCTNEEPTYSVLRANATEVDECETEAMAYEMFAQHFLQDAWSTGHMWKRWGKANFSEFPADFSLFPSETPAPFPVEDTSARRGAIALLTGAVAGTIHGAKSVIVKTGRELVGIASLADYLQTYTEMWGVADDPLNGPRYSTLSAAATIDLGLLGWLTTRKTFRQEPTCASSGRLSKRPKQADGRPERQTRGLDSRRGERSSGFGTDRAGAPDGTVETHPEKFAARQPLSRACIGPG